MMARTDFFGIALGLACSATVVMPAASQAEYAFKCPSTEETVRLLKQGVASLDVERLDILRKFLTACRLKVTDDPVTIEQARDSISRCKPHFQAMASLYESGILAPANVHGVVVECTMGYAGSLQKYNGTQMVIVLSQMRQDASAGDDDAFNTRVEIEARSQAEDAANENRRIHDLLAGTLPASP